MKKITSIVMTVVIILLALTPLCLADGTMSVTVSKSDKTINLSGICNSKFITVYLLALGKTKEDVYEGFNTQDVLYYMNQIQSNENGKYNLKIPYKKECAYTLCVYIDGSYVYKDIYETAYEHVPEGLGNIYNLPEVAQAIYGDTTKERFENARTQLPSEMPVYKPINANDNATKVFVAPNAKNGDGSIEKPYGNISDALNKLSSYENAVIYLRGGVYDNTQLTRISNIVSDPENPLIISAYNNESVVMTTGISLGNNDFESIRDRSVLEKIPMDVANKIKCIDLVEKGITSFESIDIKNMKFFADGVQYTVARWPNASCVYMNEYTGADGENGVVDSGSITAAGGSSCGSPRSVGKYGEPGFEFCLNTPHPFEWENTGEIYLNGSFYEEWTRDTVKIKSFNKDLQSIRSLEGISWGAKYNAKNKFYFSNILEELDVPGEWFLDRANGMLYVYPHADIENYVLSYKSRGCFLVTNSKNIVINGIEFKDFVGTAVSVSNCSNVMVQKCKFSNVRMGVSIGGDTTKFCGVINSSFNSSLEKSNRAVFVEAPSAGSDFMKNLIPQYNYIQNNYIYGGEGVSVRGNSNIVSHNVFSNAYGSSIYCDRVHDTVIEFNEILCGSTQVSDSGPVYLGGNRLGSGGNHVRYNYIHDNAQERSMPYGIYFDDFMSRSYAYGNIIDGAMIFLHNGSDNTIYNNIIMNSNRGIQDSQNYSKNGGLNYRWKIAALDYGAFTEFLNYDDTSKYINVLDGIYAERFPTLKDWAEKMYMRIGEYRENGIVDSSEYSVTYPNGAVTDLDTYLRSPRFNYYGNNFMINNKSGLVLSELGRISATEQNNVEQQNSDLFATGFNNNEFLKAGEYIPGFETIPYSSIGNTVNIPADRLKPVGIFPANNQGVALENIAFKWSSVAGANEYVFEISDNVDFCDTIVSINTKLNEVNLAENQIDLLKNDQSYYWRIKPVNIEKTVKSSVAESDVYRFTVGKSKCLSNCSGIVINSAIVTPDQINGYDGENATVSMFLYNCSDVDEVNGRVFVAGYDDDGNLLGIGARGMSVLPLSLTEDFDVSMSYAGKCKSFKVFYWGDSLSPYCESACVAV